VVQAGERFDRFPMGKIDQTYMWKVRAFCDAPFVALLWQRAGLGRLFPKGSTDYT
jgi:hypothetical protein